MNRAMAIRVLQTAFAIVLVLAAIVRYGPQAGAGELTSFFSASQTPTATRWVIQRLPTPTSYIPTATPLPLIHVVQKGDVLGLIAELYDTTEEELVKANSMKSSDDVIVIGQELIIAGAGRTPVPQAFDTPTPTPTPTSIYAYPAPVLLSPLHNATVNRSDAQITLQWSSVGVLAAGEWYEVRIWSSSQDPSDASRFRTRTTAWMVPLSLLTIPAPTTLRWQVSVVYVGRTVLRRSGPGETRLILLD